MLVNQQFFFLWSQLWAHPHPHMHKIDSWVCLGMGTPNWQIGEGKW